AANPAVQSRAYGTGSGCSSGSCLAPTFTPGGGLAGAYNFTVTGTPPSGISCAPNGGSTAVVCSGTASPVATTASYGIGAYTWIQPGGTGCANGTLLPGGISLNPVTGALSGTPTTASTTATDFTFQACVT